MRVVFVSKWLWRRRKRGERSAHGRVWKSAWNRCQWSAPQVRGAVVRGGDRGTPMATVAAAAAAAVLRIWGTGPDESRQRDDTVPAKVCLCGGEEGEFPGTASLPFPLGLCAPRNGQAYFPPATKCGGKNVCGKMCRPQMRKCYLGNYGT